MNRLLALLLLLTLTICSAGKAQTLPTGFLNLNGTIYASGSNCKTDPGVATVITGEIANPGPGKGGTEIDAFGTAYTYYNSGAGYAFVAKDLPPQPSTGLEGWTAESPAPAVGEQYESQQLIKKGPVKVSFSLHPISRLASEGVIYITQGTCTYILTVNAALSGQILP